MQTQIKLNKYMKSITSKWQTKQQFQNRSRAGLELQKELEAERR
jgi:hypothetical protein